MIPHSTNNTLITNSNAEQHQFEMNASAEAFKILSDGLYENKIRTIIQELSCNAFDSHVEAGKADEPFYVKLPTPVDPYFSVTDNGTGLTDEQVKNVFTVYFKSTKQKNNNVIGSKGLGAKSPLSYVSQFNVTSRHDGTITYYRVFINEYGIPAISKIQAKKTTEPNGLTVSMAVKPDDVSRFHREALDVLSWFTVPPDTNQETPIKPRVTSETYNKCYDIVECGKSFHSPSSVVALMGNVTYDVRKEFDKMLRSSENKNGRDFVRMFLLGSGKTLIIPFKLGEVETTASRESLSFDPETEKVFNERIREISDKVIEDAKKEINSYSDVRLIGKSPNIRAFESPYLGLTYAGKTCSEYVVSSDGVKNKFGDFGDGLKHTRKIWNGNVIQANSRKPGGFFAVPWNHTITLFVKDSKKHIKYNLQRLADKVNTNKHRVFVVDPELVDVSVIRDDLFGNFDVEVIYLSEEIANGHVAPKASYTREKGIVCDFAIAGNRGDYGDFYRKKMTLGQIRETIEAIRAKGYDVFLWGASMKAVHDDWGNAITRIGHDVFGKVAIIRTTEKTVENLRNSDHDLNPVSEMKNRTSEVFRQAVDAYFSKNAKAVSVISRLNLTPAIAEKVFPNLPKTTKELQRFVPNAPISDLCSHSPKVDRYALRIMTNVSRDFGCDYFDKKLKDYSNLDEGAESLHSVLKEELNDVYPLIDDMGLIASEMYVDTMNEYYRMKQEIRDIKKKEAR